MRRKLFKILIELTSLSAILSSCSFQNQFVRYDYDIKDNDTHEYIEGNNYYKLGDYAPLTYLNSSFQEESFDSYLDVYRHKNVYLSMNTTGESNLLVIPVDFEDYTVNDLRISKSTFINNINNAFFGKSENTKYESVASYFDKSSYGKLKIKGKVCDDVFRSPYTVSYLSQSKNKQLTIDIYNAAFNWYKEKFDDIEEYYVNGDIKYGCPIYLIYTRPNDNTSESVFWAYTFISSYLFSWSSYSMMYLDYFNKPDSHTYIHETGHLLSLSDYYPTNDSKFNPTGRMDMMDCSLGDETAYSKMALNWTRPYAVTGSTTINLKPFESSGELILLNDNWNGSVLDEYLLLEFYTPNYLNEYDVRIGNNAGQLMSFPGIKIYHVDSRAGFFSNIYSKPLGYVSDGGYSKNSNRVGIIHTNAYENTSVFTRNSLYEMLENHDAKSFKNGGKATNETLFYVNDDFGVTCFKDYTFNTGDKLGYTFHIDSFSENGAKITFTKN